ncbi:FlaG family protein [Campylobacter vulpis]|uniref:Flagellar biosynthesis protein FlaG n=1 Tax=Campylobacter vulpis TaxID=1655500 RepID=A0A2G4R9R7_9BACT|nr:FlaG family protein [Campylobacter vulpis]MBS4234990.1 flagellar biosynthesis protein FlaG [Campylobacter vulpis]MBS4241646.1 flagellar biosynthesis protein FlaG [Campylobacter vulpis]MBS4252017.1 flagellar biosynthesis protein FlaG [Campylobacter vulpis]MBS4268599.1 flagellar biosynthesis protein FlaG [Campylobacter vulpis]MBS4275968.1 flagellar biosynthesis protein FlaG [Campylobacter vulpis]
MEISKAMTQQQMDLTSSMKSQNSSTANAPKIEADNKTNTQGEQGKQSFAEQLQELSTKLNGQMEALGTNVRFGYNDKINSMYLSVTERTTGKEIRQIPSEEAMRLAEHFKEVVGMIFDKES